MNKTIKHIGTCLLRSTSLLQRLAQNRLQHYSTTYELPKLTLYTKDPCPLCDEALEALAPHLHKVQLEKVDITEPKNRQWWKAYKYDIPVFHLNGVFLMKHRANIDIFTDALNQINLERSKS